VVLCFFKDLKYYTLPHNPFRTICATDMNLVSNHWGRGRGLGKRCANTFLNNQTCAFYLIDSLKGDLTQCL